MQLGRGKERHIRRSQYISDARGRFDNRGLNDTSLRGSISNLFESASILTDKQSACNLTSTLT